MIIVTALRRKLSMLRIKDDDKNNVYVIVQIFIDWMPSDPEHILPIEKYATWLRHGRTQRKDT